jgi:hypothetical protein
VNGLNLFVVDTYQPLSTCSPAQPCSGSIAVYPYTLASGSTPLTMGPPVVNTAVSAAYWPLILPSSPGDVLEPTSITVLQSGAYLYVAAYDATTNPGANYVFGFSVAPPPTSTTLTGGPCPASGQIPVNQFPQGTLCPLNSGKPLSGAQPAGGPFAVESCTAAFLNAPFIVNTCPSAITSDPSSSYVYVTDVYNRKVLGYSVASATGLLTPLSGNPFPAGGQPSALVADPTYSYLYVTNALDSTVEAYSMNSGELTSLGTYGTGLEPVAIGIDPSTNHFLYTANYLGNTSYGTVSGFVLSPTAGTLINSESSPYTANAQPTAVVAIPHNGSGGGIQK